MTNINTNYKANVTGSGYDVPQGPDFTELQERIQEALAQIEGFEYADYLTEEQLAEMSRIKAMLKAESAAIAGYGLSGEYELPGAAGSSYWNQPTELAPEWNGIPPDCIHADDPYGMGLIDDPTVDFAGTVVIPNSGDVLSPTKIGFQMTDDMVSLTAESKGRDIVITVEYQDGSKRAWVIKEGTVRREPIILSAFGLSHGVTMDCSRAIRVSDGSYPNYPYGARSGFYIHGSEYNDTIYGTQGDDGIVAYAGDDIIDGMAGNDTIYGDESYEASGQHDAAYGGDDQIKGGAGYDLVYGGGGEDTTFKSDQGEAVNEQEGWINDVATSAPPSEDWFYSEDGTWQVQEGMQNGMVVVTNEGGGEAGSLQITMPPGYTMAYGEMDDSQNLIITFVGEAGTLKVKVVDFFCGTFEAADGSVASKVVNLEFRDSEASDIIDFSRLNLTSQTIKINGAFGGDDIILNARYQMLSDGLDPNDLLSSQGNNAGALNSWVNQGIFADGFEDEYTATVENGQIVIKEGAPASSETPVGNGIIGIGIVDWNGSDSSQAIEKLGLVAPAGYETGYITSDAAGNIYVILVNKGSGSEANSIVFKIDHSMGLEFGDIAVYPTNGDGEASPASLGLIPIDSDLDSYMVDGGEGSDFILTQKGGVFAGDEDDYVAEGEFDYNDINAYSTGTNELGSSPEAEGPPADDPPDEDPPAEDPPDEDPPSE